jgi:hypothetical protein
MWREGPPDRKSCRTRETSERTFQWRRHGRHNFQSVISLTARQPKHNMAGSATSHAAWPSSPGYPWQLLRLTSWQDWRQSREAIHSAIGVSGDHPSWRDSAEPGTVCCMDLGVRRWDAGRHICGVPRVTTGQREISFIAPRVVLPYVGQRPCDSVVPWATRDCAAGGPPGGSE